MLGQSNAANHAAVRKIAGPSVGAFDNGRCRAAHDPLPGGDGEGGTVWTPLAERWVQSGRSSRVLIAMTAQGATSVADWQPGGALHDRALRNVSLLEGRGMSVSRIFWLQGEADAIVKTTNDAYARGLVAALQPIVRRTQAPAVVAIVGRCGRDFSPAVRAAQMRVAADHEWALAGPDLDGIGPDQRHERCHYAETGQSEAVRLWFDALEAVPGRSGDR